MAQLTENINFLQPTNFKVVIDRQQFGNLEFFAQTVSHPEVTVPSVTIPFRGADAHQPGDKLQYGDLTIEAILDEEMQIYSEILDWMERQVQTNQSQISRLRPVSTDKIAYDVSIIILNSSNNSVRTIKYKDAFPNNIGSIQLSTTNTDVPSITMPITFTYTTFTFS